MTSFIKSMSIVERLAELFHGERLVGDHLILGNSSDAQADKDLKIKPSTLIFDLAST